MTCGRARPMHRARWAIVIVLVQAMACAHGVPPRAPDAATAQGAAAATLAWTDGGQKGGSQPSFSPWKGPGRCSPTPSPTGRNAGLPFRPEDNPRAMRAYADTLCFVERSGIAGPPASHVDGRGRNDVVLWILPERHVHQLTAAELQGPNGHIVARIWNSDPWRRDFPEWPALRYGHGPAYLWIGRENGRVVSKVFKFRGRDQVEILRTGSTEFSPQQSPPYTYARAMWGHPHLTRLGGHNVGWIDCPTGCCSATELW